MKLNNKKTVSCEAIKIERIAKLKSFEKFVGCNLHMNSHLREINNIALIGDKNMLKVALLGSAKLPCDKSKHQSITKKIDSILLLELTEKKFYVSSEVQNLETFLCDFKMETPESDTLQGDNFETFQKKTDSLLLENENYSEETQIEIPEEFTSNSSQNQRGKDKSVSIEQSQQLEMGQITEYISLTYDYNSESYVIVNTAETTKDRLQFVNSTTAKRLIYDKMGLQLSDKQMMSLPNVGLIYDPKSPFGFMNSTFDTDVYTKFNTHFEPYFDNLTYSYEDKKNGLDDYEMHPALAQLFLNLFENDKKSVAYALRWLANLVQRNKNEIAILLYGTQGAGKGLFEGLIQKLIGSQNSVTVGTKMLEDNHNESLLGKRLYFLNELDSTFRKEGLNNTIKMLITDREMTINPKFKSQFSFKNVGNILMATNSGTSVHIPHDDRRFSVFNQKKEIPKQVARDIANISESEILEFKKYLFNLDLSNFDMRAVFENETRQRMIRRTGAKKQLLIDDIKSCNEFCFEIISNMFNQNDDGSIEFEHLKHDKHFEQLIDRTNFALLVDEHKRVKPKFIYDEVMEDINLLQDKSILTSRLAVILYREAIDDIKASTTAIGRFFSNSFGKSKLFRLNNSISKGYKTNEL